MSERQTSTDENELSSRYTMDVDPTFNAELKSIAAIKGTTKAEVIRRAVAVFNYLDKETSSGENPQRKVSITDNEDIVLKDVVIPF